MNFISKTLLIQFILIFSFIGLQAQQDQEIYNAIEDFIEMFDSNVDWKEGHNLVNPKGNSISLAKAEIKINSDIRSFKQAIEDFLFQYQSDSLAQQIYKLEENGDSLILYWKGVTYESIDEATGELIGAKEELIPYSNKKLLKLFILMQEELRFFYEANTPTLFINAKANFVDTEWLEYLTKELKANLQARTGIWRVYFDNGQLAAKGNYLPFICYNLECLYGENDEMLISEKIRFIKDGLWQTYKPNGELFRILNYDKGELIDSYELIDGKLNKVIETYDY